jgi:hypothetical protein
MSQEKEAKYARRAIRAQMKGAKPLKIVPSKKGLLTTFLYCAALGFAVGMIGERIWRHFH